jgi:hypothetical protein
MTPPCVIGRRLPQGEAILEAAGVRIALLRETRPSKGAPRGPLRIVRQRQIAGGVELVTAAALPLIEREQSHD